MAKRKEKPLTPEEIKARLIQQSQPFWSHSPPLIALGPTPEGLAPIPLSIEAAEGTLILFFVDFGDYLTDVLLDQISSFLEDYPRLPWRPVILYQPKYLFLRNARFMERYKNLASFHSIPVFEDQAGNWFEALKVGDRPVVALAHQGIVVFKENLQPDPWATLKKTEEQLHKIFRIQNPGLPLFEAELRTSTRTLGKGTIEAGQLISAGNWIRGTSTLMTEDSNASVSFEFEGEHLRLLATLHPQARDPCRFTLWFNDEPLAGAHYGPHTHQGDRGSAFVEINRHQGIFEIIDAERPLRGKITLKFLNAVENPVILYSLRFA
jgi:hypothetical protein